MADRILARNIVTNTSKLIHRQASCKPRFDQERREVAQNTALAHVSHQALF